MTLSLVNEMFSNSFTSLKETATYKEDYREGFKLIGVDLTTGLVTLKNGKLTFYRFIPCERLEELNRLIKAKQFLDLKPEVEAATKAMLKQLLHSRLKKDNPLFEAYIKKTVTAAIHSNLVDDHGSQVTVGGVFHEPGKPRKDYIVIWVSKPVIDDRKE